MTEMTACLTLMLGYSLIWGVCAVTALKGARPRSAALLTCLGNGTTCLPGRVFWSEFSGRLPELMSEKSVPWDD